MRSRSAATVCAACGVQTARSSTFCPRCGAHLAASERPAPPERGPRVDRRGWSVAGLTLLALGAAVIAVDGTRGERTRADDPVAGPSAGVGDHDAVSLPSPPDTSGEPDAQEEQGEQDVVAVPQPTGRCTRSGRAPCELHVLDGGPHVAALRVGFGAIVVDEHLTVRRVRIHRDEAALAWATSLGLPADPIERRGAPVAVTRTGDVAYVGTRTHLHTIEVEGGERRWSVALQQATGASDPWTAWQVDDTVLGTAGSTLVALDAATGSLRWSRSVPGAAVARLSSGAAIVAPGRLEVVAPEQRRSQWRLELPAGVDAVAGDTHRPVSGPLTLTGARSLVVDIAGREVLADLGDRAVVSSLANGHAIAVAWEGDGEDSVLLGWDQQGRERVRQPGPPAPCCDVRLHELYDGRVAVMAPTVADEIVGWVVDPTDGRILQWVRRPEDVTETPVTVARGVAVWRDGDEHVGTDVATGRGLWRAPQDATLLLEGPVLLATRDGVVRP